MARNAYEEKIRPNLGRIILMAGKGATTKEICEALGIGKTSFAKYLALGKEGDERYRDLAEAFAQAKEGPDAEVEAALYKRACGFEYVETRREEKLDRNGKVVELVTKTNRVVPPDPTSAMFWLTNRKPKDWRYQRREQEEAEKQEGGVILMPGVEAQAEGAGADQKQEAAVSGPGGGPVEKGGGK